MVTPISRLAALVKDDEEAMEVCSILQNPASDRKTLSENFEKVLGYDPVLYIEDLELNRTLDKFVEDFSAAENVIAGNRDKIIERAHEILDERRESMQRLAIKEAMDELEIEDEIVSKFAELYLCSDEDDDEELLDDVDEFDDEEEDDISDDSDESEDDD